MKFLKKLIDSEYKELTKFETIADSVLEMEGEMASLSDKELKAKTDEFKDLIKNGIDLDELIVPAFAVVREAAWRTIKQKPFKVQIIGALALHYGNIAEMKTGEGKTLVATMPAYLNALTGKGVHIVTVNDYLVDVAADVMVGDIFRFLGLTVGKNKKDLSSKEKQEVYKCDIVYSTNNEIGFDYLRDNMVSRIEDKVQRELNYVIIDEVDSILIDEARTPLIISGGRFNAENLYIDADKAVKKLKNEVDYNVDLKQKTVSLTEEGSKKLESILHLDNLYDLDNSALVHHINQALKANYGMSLNVDYVIEDGQIIIVDQFTGRLMHGRQFSEGLHQAIEAKEGVKINEETKTMATITFQNLFRMYNKISGMTGTAKTEEEEFRNLYNMYVIQIPTNKPVIREDLADLVYSTEAGKFKAIIKTIKALHAKGQPILVGTISVESNEKLSALLKAEKIPHEVLNAKNHAREAEIIAKAGEKGAVTIATNMAGRGTDIKLGKDVKELGGLFVIGTERHEARRIDNQLRGRSGRQGDPGSSQFFVSFEDDLMKRFCSDKIKNLIQSVGVVDDQAIRSKMFTKSIETAQRKVEGNNFDARKTLLDYDDVINEQREIIYVRRNEILESEDIRKRAYESIKNSIKHIVESHIEPEGYLTDDDNKDIAEHINNSLIIIDKDEFKAKDFKGKSVEEVKELIYKKVIENYENKIKDIPVEVVAEFEKAISLQVIDTSWVDHIANLEHLREGIFLRGYGQINPLQAYTMEGFEAFEDLLVEIDDKIAVFLLRAQLRIDVERKQTLKEGNSKKAKKNKPTRVKKIGRNEPCPCGSGKKYKNCCGK